MFWFAAILALPLEANSSRGVPRVVVLSGAGVPAYREALEGFRAGWKGDAAAIAWHELEENPGDLLEKLRAVRPSVVVALGSRATNAAATLGAPVVSTMVVEAEGGTPTANVVTRIPLDVPPAVVLARLRRLLPAAKRVALVGTRGLGPVERVGILAQAKSLGLVVVWTDFAGPKEMLEAIPALREKADVIWCLPDRSLFQPASVSALILASIRNHLPLVGFSEGFVKAGALLGFYADYRAVGLQAAETVLRFREGRAVRRREAPQLIKTAINLRVQRVLGIDLPASADGLEWEQVK